MKNTEVSVLSNFTPKKRQRLVYNKLNIFISSKKINFQLNYFQRAFKALCQSTHLYGRRLVLEWAQSDEGVEEIRKRTAKHFHQGSFSYYYYFSY